MFCLNVPRKTTALIQVWGCILLAVVSVFLSFAPIISLSVTDETVRDGINEIVKELTDQEVSDFPDKVDISSAKLIGSISLVSKLLSAVGSEDAEQAEEVEAMLKGDEGRDTVLIAAAISYSFVDMFGGDSADEGQSGGILSAVFHVLVVLICLLYVLIFTLIMPLFFIISALTSLISALKHLETPEEVASKIGNKLPGLISIPMMLMLFQCVLPTMTYASGTQGLLIVAVICVVFNTVLTRLRTYAPAQMTYVNIVQGISLVSIIGFLVFFFNLLKTGVIRTFMSGSWADSLLLIDYNHMDAASVSIIVNGVLILIAVSMATSSLNYFKACLSRLSLTVTKKKGDSHIVSAVSLLLIYILPIYVKNSSKGVLELNDAQQGALNGVLVGLIIAIAAEIALLVLKNVFCEDMTKEEVASIIGGEAKTPEEALADATVALKIAQKMVAGSASAQQAEESDVIASATTEEVPAEETEEPVADDDATAAVAQTEGSTENTSTDA